MSYLALGKSQNTISTQSPQCLGAPLAANAVAAAASAVWETANSARYLPFVLSDTLVVAQLFCQNGATVSGNVDMGIYSEAGARLVSIGSTAQAGVSTLQFFNITDTTLGPGRYYLALGCDNTTATFLQHNTADADLLRSWGVLSATGLTGPTLPATATFSATTATQLVVIGLTTRTTL